MKSPFYDIKAPKRTVSLTINSDLYAQAKRLNISPSQVAEEAIAEAVARRRAEQIRAEIRQDLEALDAYESKHGSFAEIAHAHYQAFEDDEPRP